MATVEIGQLFKENRLPSGGQFALLCLYFPFGIVILTLRLFIGLHAFVVACILPKPSSIRSVALRGLCSVLGIIVSTEGRRDSRAKVLVPNYTSVFDHLACDLVYSCVVPSVWNLSPALVWLFGYKDMAAREGRATLIDNAQRHCQESSLPLLAFPEGAMTSGQVGLLKFSTWPFCLNQHIQPLAIQVRRPAIAQVSVSVLAGHWLADVLWFLFVPYTRFHIRLLGLVEHQGNDGADVLAQRTQMLLATSLGVATTSHTSADKAEFTKRTLHIQSQVVDSASTAVENPLEKMVTQVKDVLPHVPLTAIRADLALTKDVDLTITNILEGRIQFDSTSNLDSSSRPSPRSCRRAQAASQEKNVTEKPLSMQERKQRLIESSRQKYLAKHGVV